MIKICKAQIEDFFFYLVKGNNFDKDYKTDTIFFKEDSQEIYPKIDILHALIMDRNKHLMLKSCNYLRLWMTVDIIDNRLIYSV